MNYVKLIEHNDWEGETWFFFVQQDGNEEAIQYLQDELSDSDEFVLSTDLIPGEHVDILEKHMTGLTGYMDLVNRLDGRIDLARLRKFVEDGEDEKDWNDNLHSALNKGGLKSFMI